MLEYSLMDGRVGRLVSLTTLLEGLGCDRSLNLIHFIALWPNFHNFLLFCCELGKKVYYLGTEFCLLSGCPCLLLLWTYPYRPAIDVWESTVVRKDTLEHQTTLMCEWLSEYWIKIVHIHCAYCVNLFVVFNSLLPTCLNESQASGVYPYVYGNCKWEDWTTEVCLCLLSPEVLSDTERFLCSHGVGLHRSSFLKLVFIWRCSGPVFPDMHCRWTVVNDFTSSYGLVFAVSGTKLLRARPLLMPTVAPVKSPSTACKDFIRHRTCKFWTAMVMRVKIRLYQNTTKVSAHTTIAFALAN
jgi:hypothetical protein